MVSASKAKGDRAEIEVQALLRDLLGVPARRALGAGRLDDIGDIHGVPDTVVQVVNRKDIARAVREKPTECAEQQARAGATHGFTAVRCPGGRYVFVLTPEQYAATWREATS